ncbi:MAG: GNAT family N-acetyltransferase [Candidatus Azobacteroides sp.]|nr:GNAT family N-acetyltransferase [Candidatus Azobacteroides sp.]
MFKILSLDQKDRWNAIVRSMNRYDFYHLAEYHLLAHSGQSLLLYFSSGKTSLALPVILRPVEGTEYNDFTSVYGYAGPLSDRENPDEQAIIDFQNELLHFFDHHKIVSGFSRLHPLLDNQEFLLSGLGKVVETGRTVGIDLSLPEPEQKRQYAHSVKNHINRLKRKNVVVKKAQTHEAVDSFVDIYRENMKRVNASGMYYFSNDYFYRFLEELPSALFVAYHEEKAISGSLVTTCNGIVQPHLSATLDDYLRWSPLKLVWDCVRKDAVERNEKWLHLGGGVGGADDTLFQFKAQFSDLQFSFKTWRYIHNEEAYAQLVSEKYANQIPDSSYFPLYRLD